MADRKSGGTTGVEMAQLDMLHGVAKRLELQTKMDAERAESERVANAIQSVDAKRAISIQEKFGGVLGAVSKKMSEQVEIAKSSFNNAVEARQEEKRAAAFEDMEKENGPGALATGFGNIRDQMKGFWDDMGTFKKTALGIGGTAYALAAGFAFAEGFLDEVTGGGFTKFKDTVKDMVNDLGKKVGEFLGLDMKDGELKTLLFGGVVAGAGLLVGTAVLNGVLGMIAGKGIFGSLMATGGMATKLSPLRLALGVALTAGLITYADEIKNWLKTNMEGLSPDEIKNRKLTASDVTHGALVGASIGSVLGPKGAIAGAIIGATVATAAGVFDIVDDYVNDTDIMPNELEALLDAKKNNRVIKPSMLDTINMTDEQVANLTRVPTGGDIIAVGERIKGEFEEDIAKSEKRIADMQEIAKRAKENYAKQNPNDKEYMGISGFIRDTELAIQRRRDDIALRQNQIAMINKVQEENNDFNLDSLTGPGMGKIVETEEEMSPELKAYLDRNDISKPIAGAQLVVDDSLAAGNPLLAMPGKKPKIPAGVLEGAGAIGTTFLSTTIDNSTTTYVDAKQSVAKSESTIMVTGDSGPYPGLGGTH